MSEKPEALFAKVFEAMSSKHTYSEAEVRLVMLGMQAEIDRLMAECEALRAKAMRYEWLRDHPLWRVGYRIRPGKSKEWRMRDDEGDWWGNWWPTHEQAVDHWIKEQTK